MTEATTEVMSIPFGDTLSFWGLQTIAILVIALILPNLKITSIFGALGTVLLLALINATVWDAALFFSFPDSLSYQTLLLLGANTILFFVVVKLLPGIEISSFIPALIAPILFTGFNLVIERYHEKIDWSAVYNQSRSGIETVRDYIKSEQDAE